MTPVPDRLHALAASAVQRLRGWSEALGPWGRVRAASVAIWTAVSLAALLFAFSDPEANALDARVSVVTTGLGTVVMVTNGGAEPWLDLTVRLEPGGWVDQRDTVDPGEQLTLGVHRFGRAGADGEAEHPHEAWRPERVELHTADETVRVRVR